MGDKLRLRVMDEDGGDDDEVMHAEILVRMTTGGKESL